LFVVPRWPTSPPGPAYRGRWFRRLIGWSLGMLAVFTVFVYLQSTDVLGWIVS
jgi:hypothetical protein